MIGYFNVKQRVPRYSVFTQYRGTIAIGGMYLLFSTLCIWLTDIARLQLHVANHVYVSR